MLYIWIGVFNGVHIAVLYINVHTTRGLHILLPYLHKLKCLLVGNSFDRPHKAVYNGAVKNKKKHGFQKKK